MQKFLYKLFKNKFKILLILSIFTFSIICIKYSSSFNIKNFIVRSATASESVNTSKQAVLPVLSPSPDSPYTPTPSTTPAEAPAASPVPTQEATQVPTAAPAQISKTVSTPLPPVATAPVTAKKTDPTKAPAPVPTKAPAPAVQPLISSLPLSNSGQAIIIKVVALSSVNGTCEVYEKDNSGTWELVWNYPCVVGLKGVSANRHEGDLTTPEGIYGFLYEFGSAANPGTKMEYKQTQPGDYWSSVNTIEEYNTWVHYIGDPIARFGGTDKFEDLFNEPLYKYAAALDFNYGPGKILGKGSGIFLHIARSSGSGTAGCIALNEYNLLKVLRWMDPSENPKICIGTETYLRSLK